MSEGRRAGDKGRGIIQEIFGKIPLPREVELFDPTYDKYWENRASDNILTIKPTRRRAEGIKGFIDNGDSVLDVGCGVGNTLKYLSAVRDIKGTGLDISDVALAEVSAKGFNTLKIDLSEDSTSLSKVYDHIIMFEVVEHVVNAEMIITKLKGRYRKGLYVSTPNLGYIVHRLRLSFGRFPLTYISDPREHIRFWTTKDFLDWSSWLGFTKPQVIGLRGKIKILGLPSKWPSLWASDVVYRFIPRGISDSRIIGSGYSHNI